MLGAKFCGLCLEFNQSKIKCVKQKERENNIIEKLGKKKEN